MGAGLRTAMDTGFGPDGWLMGVVIELELS